MKSFMKEFKEFISRGNVMDMAVGIIIGGAFTAIVNSLVEDIINPLLGCFVSMDFSAWKIPLVGEASLGIGNFRRKKLPLLLQPRCALTARARSRSRLQDALTAHLSLTDHRKSSDALRNEPQKLPHSRGSFFYKNLPKRLAS